MAAHTLQSALQGRRYSFPTIWTRRYAHMKSRVEGRSTNPSGAQGKELMSREDFFDWCKEKQNFNMFLTIYIEWAEEDFELWFAPTIDRIDSTKGYTADNIQWMGYGDNCSKGNKEFNGDYYE